MKKLRNTIACGVAALALLATGLTSCTGDFDNINTSKDKPTPEDVDRDNAWAAFIQTMQRNVFAEGANAYQLADNLLGDSYAGYFGQAQDWDSGSNSTCYAFPTAEYMQIGKEEIGMYFNGEKSLEDTLDSIETRVNEALGK